MIRYYLFLPITLLLILTLPLLFSLFPPHFLSPPPQQLPIPTPTELSDFSLFRRATSPSTSSSTFSRLGTHHNPTLKIAFLFLTNTPLHFSPLWSLFFNTTSSDFYSIYIHADPDTLVPDPGGVFANRFINSHHTERSSATLISASRRLIAEAILDDPLNAFFALISQSCVPIHSFNYVYNTVFDLGTSKSVIPFWNNNKRRNFKSFIEILSNESTLPSRYVSRGENVMMPEVPYDKFRVGSQFFILNKKHALMVLKERKLWRKFKLPCLKIQSCYPEEHYFPTFLDMEDPDGCTRYTVTRVNWTDTVDGHPHLYRPPEVSAELIYTLRESNFSHDYLFARKFSPDCLEPLLDLADSVLFKD
ncbi:glycosyltransferase BC10-like [Silene latifolia]|uniref:glycosyltransferase BC10-like n=1 Tax=Silene latifolia TaxID=37657 RepID=UPI003D775E9A